MRHFLEYLTNPLLRGPTIGSALLGANAGVLGLYLLIRKRSLLGEALAHATYPGVVLGIVCAPFERVLPSALLVGSCLAALAGTKLLFALEKNGMSSDSALSIVLSIFFGLGVFLASLVQHSYALLFQRAQGYLFGQAATMGDVHVLLYGAFALFTLLLIFVMYKELQVLHFDREFAASMRSMDFVEGIFLLLVALCISMGIRSVGIVLISGMLIAPPLAAIPWSDFLSRQLLLAGCFGALSGIGGVYLSLELPKWLQWQISLPTGPMIVLLASLCVLISEIFSPSQGILVRLWRRVSYQRKKLLEHALKALCEKSPQRELGGWVLEWQMRWLGLVSWKEGYVLTGRGLKVAARIVRSHRLWELYLMHALAQGMKEGHRTADALEHAMTPELEKELEAMESALPAVDKDF